ncbi:hypothetical protein F5Y08DRAFT_340985 [Xylaria arbuscula]|nr:hypothetical protein F5Y08DRAFT_340985 [Xylaria arbuscula]
MDEEDYIVGADDTRPSISPYERPSIPAQFSSGKHFAIYLSFLDEHPKLTKRLTWNGGHTLTCDFKDTDDSVGHVLIHYLLTGKYQSLKPQNQSLSTSNDADFTTAVRTYKFTEDFDLPKLKFLSRHEMKRAGNQLHASQIIGSLWSILPQVSRDDSWLPGYLKTVLWQFFHDRGNKTSPGNDYSFAGILLEVFAELVAAARSRSFARDNGSTSMDREVIQDFEPPC